MSVVFFSWVSFPSYLEVTYEKSTTIPGIIEIPSRQQKSAKIGVIRYLINGSSPVSVNFFVWCQTFPWSGKQYFLLLKKVVATNWIDVLCKV